MLDRAPGVMQPGRLLPPDRSGRQQQDGERCDPSEGFISCLRIAGIEDLPVVVPGVHLREDPFDASLLGSMMKVVRSTPMYLRPYIDFSAHTP